MSYANITTALTDARADQCKRALVKQAAVRSGVATLREEKDACQRLNTQQVVPPIWIEMVLIELDLAGQIAAPTDAQVDAVVQTGVTSPAVASVWSFIVAMTKG